MDLFLRLVVTLIVAAIGGMIATKLKIPAGAMTGALIAVIIFNVFSDYAYVPSTLRTFVQMFMGAMIGCRIRKSDVYELRRCIWPTIMLIFFMILYNFIFGMLIYKFSPYDAVTSFLSVSPGGMTDMPLIAHDMGGDQTTVALMQLIRMVFIFSFITPLMRRIGKKQNGQADAQHSQPEKGTAAAKEPFIEAKRIPELLLTSLVAVAGGTLLWKLDVTAGAIIGSMIATTLFGIFTGKGYFPSKFRRGIQIFVGAFLGSQVTHDNIIALKNIPIPLIIMIAGIFAITFGASWLMKKSSSLSYLTCLLVCTPGGLQEMTLVADELGGDAPKVAVMHTVRLIVVISTFPAMVALATRLLG